MYQKQNIADPEEILQCIDSWLTWRPACSFPPWSPPWIGSSCSVAGFLVRINLLKRIKLFCFKTSRFDGRYSCNFSDSFIFSLSVKRLVKPSSQYPTLISVGTADKLLSTSSTTALILLRLREKMQKPLVQNLFQEVFAKDWKQCTFPVDMSYSSAE